MNWDTAPRSLSQVENSNQSFEIVCVCYNKSAHKNSKEKKISDQFFLKIKIQEILQKWTHVNTYAAQSCQLSPIMEIMEIMDTVT